MSIGLASISFASSRYQELAPELDGSMNLYDFGSVEPSSLPDSLSPVHISYIARHGARYLTSENKILSVEKVLGSAAAKGSLTIRGKECLELMERVRERTSGQWGMLSPVGIEQERRLGAQMAEMYPSLFAPRDAGIVGVSSYVARVVETMDNFVVPILRKNEGLEVSTSSGREYDYLTRFFATDNVFDEWRRNGEWKEAVSRFVADSVPEGPALRLVGEKSGMTSAELKRLSYDLYKVLQGLRAMSLPAPTTRWMTEEEYRRCWEATNLEKYYQYSISSLSTVPAQGAGNVVIRLLEIQSRLQSEGESGRGTVPALYGIFGHAETLLPIFSLLGIEGTVALPRDYDKLSLEWSDARLTPLAANLEIVYSRSEAGNLYVSMRLNGRNISPLADGRLIVAAGELRTYWLRRMADL